MKMRIATNLLVMIVAAAMIGGSLANFSDSETATANSFTAGTLDLKVDGEDDPNVQTINIDDIKPGDDYTFTWKLKNTGSITGDVSIKITNIQSDDNGGNEPEIDAEKDEYGSFTGGPGEGELARFLRTQVFQSHVNVESPIGWVISDYHAEALTGCHPGGSPCGGMLYIEDNSMDGQTLGEDDFQMVKLVVSLDEDVVNDGAGWWTGHDVDDNLLQSDSVSFDVVFELVQA